MKRRWLAIGCAVLCAQVGAQMGPAPVVTAEVIAQDMAPTMWAPGTVVSRSDAQINCRVDLILDLEDSNRFPGFNDIRKHFKVLTLETDPILLQG